MRNNWSEPNINEGYAQRTEMFARRVIGGRRCGNWIAAEGSTATRPETDQDRNTASLNDRNACC